MKIGDKKINPSKIICLGLNYLDHIKEGNRAVPEEPVLFTKTLNCLIGHEDPIIYPKKLYNDNELNRVDHEIELAFIICKEGKNISSDNAYDYIMGYSVFNDLTARNMQGIAKKNGRPWFMSKSLDTFGVIGPKIVELEDPHILDLELRLNGEVKQTSNTKHLLFKIPFLVEYISQYFTLKEGDIIATGTPAGVSPIQPGDLIEATIKDIGTLRNRVVLEK